ncbi:hypothetical protein [Acidipila sp. EB88]|uniref:hypothetical protein n=1 Tax=Acidipila sp. EB88 TaxID=2305226 RepID=UPI000F600EFE|nr:hypothetical protein [Acidipila sp. EB88]
MTALPQRAITPETTKSILLVGRDANLLCSRRLLLEKPGFEVIDEAPLRALEFLGCRFFHVAVLCHTLKSFETAQICQQLRARHPQTRIILICKYDDAAFAEFEEGISFAWGLDPACLLRLVVSAAYANSLTER